MTHPAERIIQVATIPPCELRIGPGSSERLATWLAARRLGVRYALITDGNVAALHAAALLGALGGAGLRVDRFVFPAGEASKTRSTKETIEDAMVSAGFGRDAAVIALGGGVVTDLAGFVAATYHRGIPYVQVPTTLLAMVDASVGGKTAVDHPKGKNLIGAFHQPSAVFIDPRFLGTLPPRELRSGLAEILKTGIIRDADLFHRMAAAAPIDGRDDALMVELISRACRIKADVVSADEREGDLRKVLNFGHTIGHAIETLAEHRLAHGEAISIGMVAESRVAARQGMLPAESAGVIESALAALGLPVRIPAGERALTPESIVAAARLDKKTRGGRIACALPEAIGRAARGPSGYGIPLDETVAIEVLAGMREPADRA